jgi:hypothetical protein
MVIARTSSPTNTVTLQIGTNLGKIFVRRTDEEFINVMRGDDFAKLPWSPNQVRERRVWKFSSRAITNVIVRQLGRTRELVRNEKFEWSIAAGSQGAINTFSLEETLHRLGELRAEMWLDLPADFREKLGFNTVDFSIELDVKTGSGKESYKVEFGGISPYGNPYALVTIQGEPRLFEFPIELFSGFILNDLTILHSQSLRFPRVTW